MTLKNLSKKKLIRSSSDQESIFSKPIIIHDENSTKIDFIIDKLPTLLDFETSFPEYFFQIKSDLNITKSLLNYKNIEGLKLYIFESESYLAVIAAGEYQPSLYKVFLETLYEKQNS